MNFPNAERQLTEFPFEEKAKTDVASPLLLQAHDLWDRKRANRLMPARADLDPVEMPKLLPHMALIEVRPYGQRLRVRLVGTNIVNIYGA
ncbi:MAG: PAS domain-containing protein, partial [Alphaproteobacteria bacterium]|nr:PAS domain-containing protein [Alphaproteobacteria bacterium]